MPGMRFMWRFLLSEIKKRIDSVSRARRMREKSAPRKGSESAQNEQCFACQPRAQNKIALVAAGEGNSSRLLTTSFRLQSFERAALQTPCAGRTNYRTTWESCSAQAKTLA